MLQLIGPAAVAWVSIRVTELPPVPLTARVYPVALPIGGVTGPLVTVAPATVQEIFTAVAGGRAFGVTVQTTMGDVAGDWATTVPGVGGLTVMLPGDGTIWPSPRKASGARPAIKAAARITFLFISKVYSLSGQCQVRFCGFALSSNVAEVTHLMDAGARFSPGDGSELSPSVNT